MVCGRGVDVIEKAIIGSDNLPSRTGETKQRRGVR
jgi:hypothetical protein